MEKNHGGLIFIRIQYLTKNFCFWRFWWAWGYFY